MKLIAKYLNLIIIDIYIIKKWFFFKWWFKITIYHKNIYLSHNRLKCSAYLIIKGEDCNSSIL